MKMQIVFQNLKKSEFVGRLVKERIESVLEKFPSANGGKAVVYVSMENSPRHAGPDQFRVRVLYKSITGKPLILAKKSQNLFEATALVVDSLLENFHRRNERSLKMRRKSQRQLKSIMKTYV